jgi:hypothetical protein
MTGSASIDWPIPFQQTSESSSSSGALFERFNQLAAGQPNASYSPVDPFSRLIDLRFPVGYSMRCHPGHSRHDQQEPQAGTGRTDMSASSKRPMDVTRSNISLDCAFAPFLIVCYRSRRKTRNETQEKLSARPFASAPLALNQSTARAGFSAFFNPVKNIGGSPDPARPDLGSHPVEPARLPMRAG